MRYEIMRQKEDAEEGMIAGSRKERSSGTNRANVQIT